MDIYSTAYLNGVVDYLPRPQSFLLNQFFRSVIVSDREEIYFDVENGARRITPFVSPLVEGKVVESLGYTTKHFKPAYTKDKRVFDPRRPLKRAIGEAIGGSTTASNRVLMNLTTESADQLKMLTRRQEVMASEALRAGTVTVSGDGYDTVVVDFGRDANHTVALLTTARWGETDVSPLSDLETWALLVSKDSGAFPEDVVMDGDAWNLFRADPRVEKILDLRRESSGSSANYVTNSAPGAQFQARIGNFNIWVYNEWYINDAGSLVPMLPQYTVIMGSPMVDGVRHFGAILDEEAGFVPREFFSKSWTKQDPAVRFLMQQSAPLMVPYRPDATLCATVR